MGKPGQSRQAKFGEKGEVFFLVKMPLWYILSIPKCKNMFRSALKLHLHVMSLKLLVFQYNSFIQTSKISKNHFFPRAKRPTFQNVITCATFQGPWNCWQLLFQKFVKPREKNPKKCCRSGSNPGCTREGSTCSPQDHGNQHYDTAVWVVYKSTGDVTRTFYSWNQWL
jgi:hypothetical protein